MILKDIIMRTSFRKVLPELRKVLHGKKTPCIPKVIKEYRIMFGKLKKTQPNPSSMVLLVAHLSVRCINEHDYFEIEGWCDSNAEYRHCYDFTWDSILGMEIVKLSFEELSLEAIVANCLYAKMNSESIGETEQSEDEDDTEETTFTEESLIILRTGSRVVTMINN